MSEVSQGQSKIVVQAFQVPAKALGTWSRVSRLPIGRCGGSRPHAVSRALWLPSVLLQILPDRSCEIISFSSVAYGWNFTRIQHSTQHDFC